MDRKKIFNERKLVLFGSGKAAEQFYIGNSKNIKIEFVIDNNYIKGGGYFLNKFEIKSPNEILKNKNKFVIVVCSCFYKDISNQLKEYGLIEYIDFYNVDLANRIINNEKQIDELCDFVMKKEKIFNQSVKSALKSGKKIIMLYGNCFVTNIKNRLLEIKDFNEKYFLLFIPASYQFLPYEIYEIPDKFLKACDVFIYQRLDNVFGKKLSSNYIISKLKSTCLKLSVPKFYFNIYFPQCSTTSICDIANIYAYGTHPYFIDRNIELLYSESKSLDEIISVLNGCIYPFNYLKKAEEKMNYIIKRLKDSLDISVSDYILNNYKKELLFQDPYHPFENIIIRSFKKDM